MSTNDSQFLASILERVEKDVRCIALIDMPLSENAKIYYGAIQLSQPNVEFQARQQVLRALTTYFANLRLELGMPSLD